MKKRILVFGIAMAAMLLPALASNAYGQGNAPLSVKIPFNFTVCREQLQAGKYTIQHPPGNTRTLVIRSEDNRSIDIACVNDMESPKVVTEGKLIFTRYGDQYFLAEAWWPGDKVGHSLLKSEREQALIKELSVEPAKKGKKPEKVIIKIVKP